MTNKCNSKNLTEACSTRINLLDYERNYKRLQDEILGTDYVNDGHDSYNRRALTTSDIIEKFNQTRKTIRFLSISLSIVTGALILCAIEIVKMFL